MSKQRADGSWLLGQLNLAGLQMWTGEQQEAAKDLICKSCHIFPRMIWI